MYYHVQKLINPIASDEPDPAAANALQEGLGGQFGEMRTMMQYLFQSFNFRGKAKPYLDLIQGVGLEEISHVELIATTINRLLDGSPRYNGEMGEGKNGTPLETALGRDGATKGIHNIHHYLVGAQSAMPVDAVGNPWSGSYVYNSGNLTLDLLYNLMLEATGRLQKCRLYEMSDNKTFRSTVAYLIVRDAAHEKVFAKALESLGVDFGKVLPIPKFDATQFPEVRALIEQGVENVQFDFRMDGTTMGAILNGPSPVPGDGNFSVAPPPEGVPITPAPERSEEFSPGLPPELKAMAEQMAAMAESAATV